MTDDFASPSPNTPEGNPVYRFGLELPNTGVAWGNYRGHDLDTPAGRSGLVAALRQAAVNLDFAETDFLGHYRWRTRVETPSHCFPITSPTALGPQETGDTASGDQSTGDGDTGAVQQGPVGGLA